jgi:hypothetical protein
VTASFSSLPSIEMATRLTNWDENSEGFEDVGRLADPRATAASVAALCALCARISHIGTLKPLMCHGECLFQLMVSPKTDWLFMLVPAALGHSN